MRAPELREHGVCREGLFREEGKPSSLFFLRRRRAEARAGRKVGRKRAGPLRVLRPECAPFSGDTRSAEETGGRVRRKSGGLRPRREPDAASSGEGPRGRRPRARCARGGKRRGRNPREKPMPGLRPEFMPGSSRSSSIWSSGRTQAGVSGGASVFFRAVFLPDRHGRQSFSGSRAGEKGRFRLLSGLRNEVLCLRKGTPVCFFAFPTGDVA